MKITSSQLRKIIAEEIEAELDEQEELDEGFGKTLATVLATAALSMGIGAKTAHAEPVKVKVLNVQNDHVKVLNMDDEGVGHHELKMLFDRELAKKFGAGKFVVVDVQPGGDASDMKAATPEKSPQVSAKKAVGGSEVLKVEGDTVTVKVPFKVRGNMDMARSSAEMQAKSTALDAVSGKSVGKGSRVSSGTARVLSSEIKDGFMIAKVKVGK
jgi:hypothetical protein